MVRFPHHIALGFLLGGQGQNRTADLRFFRPSLYQLSYLAVSWDLAGMTGFEPATSGLTGRRELLTSPHPRVDRSSTGGTEV